MLFYKAWKRRFYLLFSLFHLFFFLSCAKQTSYWDTDFTLSENIQDNSAFITYTPPVSWNRICLEGIRTKEGITLYLISNTTFRSIEKENSLKISYGSSCWEGKGFIFEGGYKALVPPDGTSFLLQGLEQNLPVDIIFGLQRFTIEPSNFNIKYRRFLNVPLKYPSSPKRIGVE